MVCVGGVCVGGVVWVRLCGCGLFGGGGVSVKLVERSLLYSSNNVLTRMHTHTTHAQTHTHTHTHTHTYTHTHVHTHAQQEVEQY